MKTLLFGGTIFPNQSSIENNSIQNTILDWLIQRFRSCYECKIEWAGYALYLSVIILLVYLVYRSYSSKK